MTLKKDKQKVLNEQINEQQLLDFLSLVAPAGVDTDYHILERAYRGLQAPDFKRFIALFIAQNRNINALGPEGSLLNIVQQHNDGNDYASVLQNAGAKT